MSANPQAICGCCTGIETATPQAVDNRPGLTAIAYRTGDHARFRQTLIARLAAYPRQAAYSQLAGLTSRSPDDFSIALLDAVAVLADVLTFYQERIANEHYLPTATERRSALELGQLVGYRLRPGVAADVWLAFTLEAAQMPGSAPETTLQPGIRTQSIPGPGETAQSFETVEAVRARPEWNAMRPRLTRYQTFTHASTELRLVGLATGLKPGDGLILTSDDQVSRLSIVTKLELRTDVQATLVGLKSVPVPTPSPPPTPGPTIGPGGGRPEVVGTLGGGVISRAVALPREAGVAVDSVSAFARAGTFTAGIGTGFGGVLNTTVSGADLFASAQINDFNVTDLFAHLQASAPPPKGVLALRTRAGIFGHNAPPFLALPEDQQRNAYKGRNTTWVDSAGITLASAPYPSEDVTTAVYLDNVYPPIAAGGFVAVKQGDAALVYKLNAVAEVSRADFGLSAKATRLDLDGGEGLQNFSIRGSTVFAQSEELKLARLPIEDPVSGHSLELEGWIEGLYPGQRLIVCGERADLIGVKHCESAEIDSVEYVAEQEGFTRLVLKAALQHAYRRDSVGIHGNVARATHGEAVSELLGGGDARVSWQSFELRQPPLTQVSSSAPEDAGARSSLEIRADGVAWHEVPSFFGQPPEARVFVTRLADDGKTTVRFGDGRTGAKPPGGTTNLRARYRKGIGRGGNVRAGQISLLLSRPLGLKEVANPIAAAGGADAESLDDVRRNAPLSVRTLGRVVSLSDYADFARAFAGVAKAHAAWVWDGGRRVVALSVAGTDGAVVAAGSPLHGNLLAALAQAGDPNIPVALLSYTPGLVRMQARLKIDPDHEAQLVLAAADAAVRQSLAFAARDFGEPVAASRVTALLQAVPGVRAVDMDTLYRALETPALQSILFAASPQSGAAGLAAAELLTLDPGGLSLEVLP